MTAPIWQKQSQASVDNEIMNYMAGEDILLDNQIFLFDIQASKAHVKGLNSITILDKGEADSLIQALDELAHDYNQGVFHLSNQFEDGHSAIEYYLVEKLGDLGKKIHTGRSRNDQVSVATRLLIKHSLKQAEDYIVSAVRACLAQAKLTKDIPMPGYTHLQRAVPSSAGMWFAGFAEAMIDNLMSLQFSLQLLDANPLGTAAGYGVNLPLDRELTTNELDFSRLQINPIYTQNSRGKFELEALFRLSQCLLDIRRFCWDLSLFTSQEFNFVNLPDNMTTGSSIMPNKRNPDLIELMRGSYATLQGAMVELQSILSLPSGYQRDLQLTKPPLLKGLKVALDTIKLFSKVVSEMSFKADVLEKAIDAPMYATDLATEQSIKGIPFREAYQSANDLKKNLADRLPMDSLTQRTSPGACANLLLDELESRFNQLL
ncbi:argininosuccinate lyase [Aliikangiella marina]|uniref:Argininosuccinate lyase n=1 Tax=Aliikangiella marina TaxID=1712262 RepID=A0A545T2M1_9GAMM|nr:argininosuccinate lyase [Aliikangiella marina]TQV71467.1 argininosuccinate lyase [Aliikangiella marina]